MPDLPYDLADLHDIPGTTIFTADSARRAYHLHRFCMSLMKEENRQRFRADEAGWLATFAMTAEQRDAVLARDYNRMIALGGNIYFLVKIASTDGISVAQAVSTMTDLDVADYTAMMIAGGRTPQGNRSIKGGW
ncbi:protocatechuate 4,5-dioxygenase subunit alpha [Sphingomonas suaedae]|uniref:Protocatechuate 4,5-dioxygenase subunit alpha n=1 Tax=Sphingomonas suaedae TaxID=2599297 RepID=A0A518RJQ7_9SPHN|nr:protocatechuate 4,5-dioxygenase subunit alpha [Sphingomonas suaedae]QDX27659.1 protocatechuate 4,5-dioxygenase subunit alpha [Sphingomonas suaedae]